MGWLGTFIYNVRRILSAEDDMIDQLHKQSDPDFSGPLFHNRPMPHQWPLLSRNRASR